jgi:hypothetical protein
MRTVRNSPGWPRRRVIGTILGALCVAHTVPLSAQSQTPQDKATALDAVRRLGLGKNLPALAFQVASRTQTYAIVVSQLGEPRARELLVQHVQRAVPSYQDQWDHNLAAAYLERLTAAEIASVAELGSRSPSVPKMMSEQNAIGTAMQARSAQLLTDMVAAILADLFKDAVPRR